VADRRAIFVPVDAPELPRRARAHADRLVFVERLEPSTQEAEDRDTARVVIRFQAGDKDAFTELYMRYFDRVYGYLRVALRDAHEAEDVTQQVFMKVLDNLPRYERLESPFRAWLTTILRNQAIDSLRRLNRFDVEEPEEINRRRDVEREADGEMVELDWISDRDLLLFIERLPLAQRQVLLLRYLLGLSTDQIAEALGRTRNDVSALHSRAVRFLRARLAAVGRTATSRQRARISRWPQQALVARRRRFALLSR
jgi:RNA polymerase sigma-70 factor (ECF subfamily)